MIWCAAYDIDGHMKKTSKNSVSLKTTTSFLRSISDLVTPCGGWASLQRYVSAHLGTSFSSLLRYCLPHQMTTSSKWTLAQYLWQQYEHHRLCRRVEWFCRSWTTVVACYEDEKIQSKSFSLPMKSILTKDFTEYRKKKYFFQNCPSTNSNAHDIFLTYLLVWIHACRIPYTIPTCFPQRN